MEGFVAGELRRQVSWAEESVRLHHYRDRNRGEVDFVLETPDGRVAGIEVKSTSTPKRAHFSALRRFQELVGDTFTAGVLLHSGPRSLPQGEKLASAPIDVLWQ